MGHGQITAGRPPVLRRTLSFRLDCSGAAGHRPRVPVLEPVDQEKVNELVAPFAIDAEIRLRGGSA